MPGVSSHEQGAGQVGVCVLCVPALVVSSACTRLSSWGGGCAPLGGHSLETLLNFCNIFALVLFSKERDRLRSGAPPWMNG